VKAIVWPPICPIVKRLLILNWWIGSRVMRLALCSTGSTGKRNLTVISVGLAEAREGRLERPHGTTSGTWAANDRNTPRQNIGNEFCAIRMSGRSRLECSAGRSRAIQCWFWKAGKLT
jgi:hypothetical protein